jgi:hypothetical protein
MAPGAIPPTTRNTTGIQLADENLINRPRHSLTDANFRRFDEIDPDSLFVSWLGRPAVG